MITAKRIKQENVSECKFSLPLKRLKKQSQRMLINYHELEKKKQITKQKKIQIKEEKQKIQKPSKTLKRKREKTVVEQKQIEVKTEYTSVNCDNNNVKVNIKEENLQNEATNLYQEQIHKFHVIETKIEHINPDFQQSNVFEEHKLSQSVDHPTEPSDHLTQSTFFQKKKIDKFRKTKEEKQYTLNFKNAPKIFFKRVLPFIKNYITTNTNQVYQNPSLRDFHLKIIDYFEGSIDCFDLQTFYNIFDQFTIEHIQEIIQCKQVFQQFYNQDQNDQQIQRMLHKQEERCDLEKQFEQIIKLLLIINDVGMLEIMKFSEEISSISDLKNIILSKKQNLQPNQFNTDYSQSDILNFTLKQFLNQEHLDLLNKKIQILNFINNRSRIITQVYLQRKFQFDIQIPKIEDKISYITLGIHLSQFLLHNPKLITSLK